MEGPERVVVAVDETAPQARGRAWWAARFERWCERNYKWVAYVGLNTALAVLHAVSDARDHAPPPPEPAAQVQAVR
jgi:hypothetical protein